MSTYLKIFSITVFLFLIGCDQDKTSTNQKAQSPKLITYTVLKENINENIEQTGVITPLTLGLVVSPVSGFVTHQYAPYGSNVKKDDQIFVVSDSSLSSDVFAKISDYHNAKWDYESDHNKYLDYKLQFKSGLVAQEEVKLREIALYRSELKLFQTEFELKKIAEKINKPLEKLKSTDVKAIKSIILNNDKKDSIVINAPDNGTLIPLILDVTKEDNTAKVGSKVEGGQAFAAIANLNQGEIKIELDENQVHKLRNGMTVEIKSLSQPNLQLTGTIYAIKFFEFNQKSDNMTRYPVIIRVESQNIITPGTRCKIIVPMKSRNAIIIPINAVHDPYQKPYVIMEDGTQRNVMLGKTDVKQVEITSGLSENETILVPQES